MDKTDAREQILAMVKKIVTDCFAGQPVRIYLFGSWARGEERRSSDIDIAVEHDGRVARSVFASARERLDEAPVPYRVDLVDLAASAPELAAKVREEGILWREYTSGLN
ncbi:DNA polymerase, beta domain protein region [Thermosinus carboxydivorans Nor1]|uniref:DNA polymerase, beta domain protein region n=1 Tax=Thermosinus carboxydivorans Nor1 TaxID=401526 RepID=A1HMA0_9FIRM|nr:nucleotidyltransferase domain-containing protein [Thermosinus carboxydivorans]EAX48946.1 DNA polymerase, beta domain protein region [Thermosinus carboxydivorans Nor1]